jgi:predicted transglutaminase-like cysteine proteinase
MTKHRRITGLVIIALLTAAATTAAAMRPHSPSTNRPIAPAGMMSFKELAADVNRLPTDDFDDQSLVYSTKR